MVGTSSFLQNKPHFLLTCICTFLQPALEQQACLAAMLRCRRPAVWTQCQWPVIQDNSKLNIPAGPHDSTVRARMAPAQLGAGSYGSRAWPPAWRFRKRSRRRTIAASHSRRNITVCGDCYSSFRFRYCSVCPGEHNSFISLTKAPGLEVVLRGQRPGSSTIVNSKVDSQARKCSEL